MTTALAAPAATGNLSKHEEPSLDQALMLARALSKSGFFPNARDEFKALAVILAGREFGWSPTFALMNIQMTENGKLVISAAAMAAQIKNSGKYDYDVLECDDKGAVVEWYRIEWDSAGARKPVSLGKTSFTFEEAKRANLHGKFNWKAYPADMCLWRAVSRGAKRFCADVFLAPVYTDADEIPLNGERGLGVKVNVLQESEGSIDAQFQIAAEKPKPKVRLGAAPVSEPVVKPQDPAEVAKGGTVAHEGVTLANCLGIAPGSHDLAPDAVEPATADTSFDTTEIDALKEIFAPELADRILALAPGDTLGEVDLDSVGATVQTVLGTQKAALAAWKAVGVTGAGAVPKKEHIIAVAKSLATK